MFIVIEGRDQRGAGMDLSQVSQYLLNIPNFNVRKAINLDGGGSSMMTVKRGNTILSLNPNRLDTYPVGSILSYVRYPEDIDMV